MWQVGKMVCDSDAKIGDRVKFECFRVQSHVYSLISRNTRSLPGMLLFSLSRYGM